MMLMTLNIIKGGGILPFVIFLCDNSLKVNFL